MLRAVCLEGGKLHESERTGEEIDGFCVCDCASARPGYCIVKDRVGRSVVQFTFAFALGGALMGRWAEDPATSSGCAGGVVGSGISVGFAVGGDAGIEVDLEWQRRGWAGAGRVA